MPVSIRKSSPRYAPAHGLKQHQLEAVARLFAALSEPNRLLILQVLQKGPAAVGEIVDRTGCKQANVSKQLGVLLMAGVIGRRRDGNRVIYSIQMPLVFDLCVLVCDGLADQATAYAKGWRR